jgi:hypothetical protein
MSVRTVSQEEGATLEADIDCGKPPSYYIVTKDANVLWSLLH